jgi:cytoplasmic iron level regulating protein YaaA (DUF328/UPF0246 family)|tara:strand:+ start:20441 stop:21229 length:789 start_codon:yes stop_codon:yes gene_type:complete
MIIVVSPAKSLDYKSPAKTRKFTLPEFLPESQQLVSQLKKLAPADFSELMHISAKLGELNHSRFLNWHTPFDLKNAKQAIFAFKGDVYIGLEAEQLTTADLNFAQKHLRILSGLYGLLRPLDLMQPYRLEMGSSFIHNKGINASGKNLYAFWDKKLTRNLNALQASEKNPTLVNLASREYFSAIKLNELEADVITPVFKDFSGGQYRVLSFFAKKARGAMSAYIIRNRIAEPEKLKDFAQDGYRYSEADSTSSRFTFLRKQP